MANLNHDFNDYLHRKRSAKFYMDVVDTGVNNFSKESSFILIILTRIIRIQKELLIYN